jgi:oligoribonuclease
MNTINPLNLIWIDLEMTGLDPEQDRIIEIATVVTDAELNVLAEGPSMAIHQAETLLDGMDDWNTTHHGNSGLAERVRKSTINEQQASQATLEFLQQWVPKGQSPMCGNTVGQDRRFLTRYMPELAAFFHYRNIDVSTLKELARRWKPELLNGFIKKGSHLALDDIYDSIAELSHYRTTFIRT